MPTALDVDYLGLQKRYNVLTIKKMITKLAQYRFYMIPNLWLAKRLVEY